MAGLGCCFLGFLIVAGAIWFAVSSKGSKRKRLEDAEEAYRSSLVMLSQEPNNAGLKQRALALGREYSALTREQNVVALYDEIAIMNDIAAACAGAGATTVSQNARATSQQTPQQRLLALVDLRDRGLVSEEEFQRERARILGEL